MQTPMEVPEAEKPGPQTWSASHVPALQASGSERVSTQPLVPYGDSPLEQAPVPHTPAWQCCPPVQTFPQLPQLVPSYWRSVQIPGGHNVSGLQPVGVTHAPATQFWPVPHACPQLPQLRGLS